MNPRFISPWSNSHLCFPRVFLSEKERFSGEKKSTFSKINSKQVYKESALAGPPTVQIQFASLLISLQLYYRVSRGGPKDSWQRISTTKNKHQELCKLWGTKTETFFTKKDKKQKEKCVKIGQYLVERTRRKTNQFNGKRKRSGGCFSTDRKVWQKKKNGNSKKILVQFR